MRAIISLSTLLLAGLAAAQQPLPNLKVNVDGQPAEIGQVMLELDTYLVPLRDAVRALTAGKGSIEHKAGQPFEVVIDGKPRVRIPVSAKSGPAEVLGSDGWVVARIPMASDPYELSGTTYVDVDLLAAALGVTVDLNGSTLSLLTPAYWCGQLGLKGDDRLLSNLANLPDFGVSPPAQTLLGWVRPRGAGRVQVYRLGERRPEPLMGTNALGDPIEVLTPGDTPSARVAKEGEVVRFETNEFGAEPGQTVSFVALLTKENVDDPMAAIKAGRIKPDAWAIVGLRQRVNRFSLLYENRPVKEGEDLAAFAERNRTAVSIVRDLNGLRPGERPPAGTKLCVIVGLDETKMGEAQRTAYGFKGTYEVQPGDTVASIAQSWGVEANDIVETNPGLPPGGEPQAGDLLNVIVRKDGVKTKAADAPPTPQEDTTFSGTAAMTDSVDIRQTSDPSSPVVGKATKGSFVEVLGVVKATDRYRIRTADAMGFVDGKAIRLRDTGSDAPDPSGASPAPPAEGSDLVAREALKYVGTPYLWGGNSLTRGIDCSHYVAQVYTRIGWPEPPPPVVKQETIGAIVNCKPGTARRGGQSITLPNASKFPYATTNLRSLRPGDRIIFQRGNSDASGSRHTGIFIGQVPASWRARFGEIPYAFAHASSSRGVTVGSLTQRYYWNLYRYSVRSTKGGQ